jgi:hypothetical protein
MPDVLPIALLLFPASGITGILADKPKKSASASWTTASAAHNGRLSAPADRRPPELSFALFHHARRKRERAKRTRRRHHSTMS